jgi:hypothetical protein
VIPSTSNQLDTYIGKDLDDNKRGLYKLKYPVKHGVIENWDDMELLWKHAYSLMKISPSEAPVLLTEANQNPSKHRKKMLEIFFEKFQAPAALVAIQGVLSLYLLFNLVMQQVNQQVLSWTLGMESHMLFLSMKDTPLPIAVRELTLEVVMSLNTCEIFSEKVVLIWTPALNLNSLRT